MFWFIETIQNHINYIDIIIDLIKRDFKLKYLNSLLGKYWNFIYPLVMILIYTYIFSIVLKAKLSAAVMNNQYAYVIYLCSGLLVWNLCVDAINKGVRMFFDYAHIIKKVYFSLDILPLVIIGSASINFFIIFGIYLLVILFTGYGFSIYIFFFPILYLLLIFFLIGISLILAIVNVAFRDVEQMVNILFMILFWITPIVYQFNLVPLKYRFILFLNPFFYFIHSFQLILFYKQMPFLYLFIVMSFLSISSLLFGCFLLKKVRSFIYDEI